MAAVSPPWESLCVLEAVCKAGGQLWVCILLLPTLYFTSFHLNKRQEPFYDLPTVPSLDHDLSVVSWSFLEITVSFPGVTNVQAW